MVQALLELRVSSACPDVFENCLPNSLGDRLVVSLGDYFKRLGGRAWKSDGGRACIHSVTIARILVAISAVRPAVECPANLA